MVIMTILNLIVSVCINFELRRRIFFNQISMQTWPVQLTHLSIFIRYSPVFHHL